MPYGTLFIKLYVILRQFFVSRTVNWEPLGQFTSIFAQLLELIVLRSIYFLVKFRFFIPELWDLNYYSVLFQHKYCIYMFQFMFMVQLLVKFRFFIQELWERKSLQILYECWWRAYHALLAQLFIYLCNWQHPFEPLRFFHRNV
jgi:hypothetical protein